MHISERIEKYCVKIRQKFYSNRKMTFDQKRAYAINVVETLNFGNPYPLNVDYILKILELDQEDTLEYWS